MSLRPSETTDRPNRIAWPPIIDAAVLAGAWLLERIVPLTMMPESQTLRWAGWLVAAAGLAIAIAGFGYFQSIGTPVNPTGQAKTLATGGIYAYTRNPMYLGSVVAFIGLAFGLGSAWLVILTLLMPVALRKLAIEREEAYLLRRFGASYEAYSARVRRWV